jgi:hypothetical protein
MTDFRLLLMKLDLLNSKYNYKKEHLRWAKKYYGPEIEALLKKM